MYIDPWIICFQIWCSEYVHVKQILTVPKCTNYRCFYHFDIFIIVYRPLEQIVSDLVQYIDTMKVGIRKTDFVSMPKYGHYDFFPCNLGIFLS